MSISQQPPTDNQEEQSSEQSAVEKDKPKSPFHRVFPIHPSILAQASRLASKKTSKVDDLALIALQDPILVLELIKVSNSTVFSAGRPPTTNASGAIMRLGEDEVLNLLKSLSERPGIDEPGVSELFEKHRSRGRRAGIIARILAEVLAKSLSEDCHTAGLFMFMGDMLATAHLGAKYVQLYNANNYATLLCRLAQDHRFNVETMGTSYLEKNGVPHALLFAVTRDGKPKSPDRAPMKPICYAAAEMVDAFDSNKWEKLAPGKQLSPKSAFRFLRLSGAQHMKVYEKASEFLFQDKLQQERQAMQASGATEILESAEDSFDFVIEAAHVAPTNSVSVEPTNKALEDDLLSLLEDQTLTDKPQPSLNSAPTPSMDRKVLADSFSISAENSQKTTARVESPLPRIAPPPLRTSAGNTFINNVTSELDKAQTSEELLRNILAILTDTGPFEKSALIVVSKDRTKAVVVAARGPGISSGQNLELSDPLSPLAQCFSKVQSFGNRSNQVSPWGSKAFALSPIDADHDTPVALYADCGNQGSVTFEARRIFRVVVDILNQKLPTIPGGIPVEV